MGYFNQYVRAESLEEAYGLYQKKNNFVLGGMLWLKMRKRPFGTAIDLSDLGLDQIEEDEKEFRIGAYVSLRELETNEALNTYTKGAFAESVKHIVGVQFRNVATVGGSLWGRYGFSDVMTIFRAMGAKVQLHHAGILDLDEFVKMPRKTRDILVSVIVPKKVKAVVYLSQRNQSTDFPVLTCKRVISKLLVSGVFYLSRRRLPCVHKKLKIKKALKREDARQRAAWQL